MMVKNFTTTEASSPFQKFFCLNVIVFQAFEHCTLFLVIVTNLEAKYLVFSFRSSQIMVYTLRQMSSLKYYILRDQRSLLNSISAFVFIFLLTGVLVVLDAHPGGIIYRDLIPEYVNYARTIYEGFPATLSE